MSSLAELQVRSGETAVLDSAHVGDIRGALGTIRRGDIAPRKGWWTRLRTLLAILGPRRFPSSYTSRVMSAYCAS
jgi:hypothetical protein